MLNVLKYYFIQRGKLYGSGGSAPETKENSNRK